MTVPHFTCSVFEGLCNRLNAIASALATQRPVRLHWAVNSHCPLPYEEVLSGVPNITAINEEIDSYRYVADPNALCWFYPRNVLHLPTETFRSRMYAAYRELLDHLKAISFVTPQRQSMGCHFRHYLPEAGTFDEFVAGLSSAVTRIRPACVHVCSDSTDHKERLIRLLEPLVGRVTYNQGPLLSDDLARSPENVRAMCSDLVSLTHCEIGVLTNSCRSTIMDALRGYGVYGYATHQGDAHHRMNGRDDLYEMRPAAALLTNPL